MFSFSFPDFIQLFKLKFETSFNLNFFFLNSVWHPIFLDVFIPVFILFFIIILPHTHTHIEREREREREREELLIFMCKILKKYYYIYFMCKK
jgi:hypothetical protein